MKRKCVRLCVLFLDVMYVCMYVCMYGLQTVRCLALEYSISKIMK